MEKKLRISLTTLLFSIVFLAIGCAGLFLSDLTLICVGFAIGVPTILGGAIYTIVALYKFNKEVKK